MTASTGEEPTEDQDQDQTPPDVEPRTPFDKSEKIKAFVARHAADIAARDADHPEYDVEPTDAGRGEVRQQIIERAWVTSLEASKKQDLSEWRLDRLAADQHARELRALARGMRAPVKRNLLFAGDTGPGKTSAAIALGWAAIDMGLSARFIDHNKYARWTQTSDSMPKHPHPYWDLGKEQLIHRMTTCDVLVLDDLGRGMSENKAVSEHILKVTTELIDDRIETPGAITVITMNHRRDSIDTMFGGALLSRLAKAGKVFKFEGPDRRGRLDW